MAVNGLATAAMRCKPAGLRFAVLFSILFVVAILLKITSPRLRMTVTIPSTSPFDRPAHGSHPIDQLIENAEAEFNQLLSKRTTSLHGAASQYRQLRGRNPPPGFDAWYRFAHRRSAVIVEEFFDQIYHDLRPYWGRPAAALRHEARSLNARIEVRNGNASLTDDGMRTPEWHDMVSTIAEYLPDMDIPFNRMDEPRLTVPWEEIGELLAREGEDRRVVAPAQTKRSFSELITNDGEPPLDISWEANDTPLFARARRGCPPDSAAQQAPVAGEWTKSHIATSNAEIHSYMGYVRNTTLATSICHQPDLQSNQGIFIEPISLRTSSHLYPMFGECKLSTNNEILIPSHAYWMKSEQYSGGDDHGVAWQWKLAKAIWRGANAGGRNHKDNWASFQRTRFVAMVNGTKVGRIETGEELPVNFKMPSTSSDLHAAKERHLGEWLSTVADAGLVSLLCWPTQPDLSCPYLEPHFDTVDGVPMAEQYKRKYLPDIDGNSFSGRYRAFLLSTSLPIKSTIFQEWHDSRLVAWKHYVPMDARFHDFYGIMEYFVGYDLGHVDPTNRIRGHDAAAERIATAGMKWANKVLRREDMQIYMFRLLLEYARLLDDERVELGYVDDLQPWF